MPIIAKCVLISVTEQITNIGSNRLSLSSESESAGHPQRICFLLSIVFLSSLQQWIFSSRSHVDLLPALYLFIKLKD